MRRLKNYQITRTTLLPAATVVYWKINTLPSGNLPEITVGILLKSELCQKSFKFCMRYFLGVLNNVLYVFLLKFASFLRHYICNKTYICCHVNARLQRCSFHLKYSKMLIFLATCNLKKILISAQKQLKGWFHVNLLTH